MGDAGDWDLQARNIRVRAWDRAGNSTERTVAVWIDTVAPTTYDLVHDQETYVNGPVVYSWSVLPDAAGISGYQIQHRKQPEPIACCSLRRSRLLRLAGRRRRDKSTRPGCRRATNEGTGGRGARAARS